MHCIIVFPPYFLEHDAISEIKRHRLPFDAFDIFRRDKLARWTKKEEKGKCRWKGGGVRDIPEDEEREHVSGCVQVENTDKKFRERVMNPGGARRGRGRGCKPVGPSIHSLRILATFYQGIQSQNISIHGGMAARGTTLPPFVHHSLLLLFPRSHHRVPHASATWHVHSTPFHEKESVRMITGIQIKARLVIDRFLLLLLLFLLLLRSKRVFERRW